jgi:hypothetical protein
MHGFRERFFFEVFLIGISNQPIDVKTVFYLCLLAGAVVLPVSERARSLFLKSASVAVSVVADGGERVFGALNSAEIRTVNGSEFDRVIRESGRLVIVDIHQEDVMVIHSEKSKLDRAIEKLPSKVLVAKVQAGKNIELMDRLQIRQIPTLLVYRNGQLLEEFSGKVDKDRFLEVVHYHLNNPKSKPYHDGYIGPLKKNWLPEGLKPMSKSEPMTHLNLED